MLIKDLQKLGFTKNLSTVYLTLFELGEAKAGELVRRTGMHRNLVYTALDQLEETKLVTKSQTRGVALYTALDPIRIMGAVDEKKKLAEEIIEELRSKHKVKSQEVIIYEGKEEIRRKYLELYSSLNKDDYWYMLGLSPKFFEINGQKYIDKFTDIQVKRGIRMKGVSGYIDKREDNYLARTKGLTEFKLVPGIAKKDSEISIVKDRVLIFIFTEPYTVVEIFNKDLVESYKEYFDYLWNQEVRTYSGWKNVTKLFNEIILNDLKKDGGAEYVIGAGYGELGEADVNKKVDELFLEHNGYLIKNKIHKHVILYEKHRQYFEDQVKHLGDPAFTYVHTKYLPDSYDTPVETHIFKKRAVITYFGESPISTTYEHPKIIQGFKKQFDMMWNLAKE